MSGHKVLITLPRKIDEQKLRHIAKKAGMSLCDMATAIVLNALRNPNTYTMLIRDAMFYVERFEQYIKESSK